MEYQEKNYLKTRNLILIVASLLLLIFVCPGGNMWLQNPINFKENWGFYLSTEIIFVMLLFSFKSIIDKDYKQVIFLAFIGSFNFVFALTLIFFLKLPAAFIPFVHPVTISLVIPLLIERKFKYAIIGYFIGYFFSFLPLIGSLTPVLFFHLWLNSSSKLVIAPKISRFLSRIFMYSSLSLVSSILIYEIRYPEIRFISVSFSKNHEIFNALMIIIVIYYILNQYLNEYYSKYGNKTLKFLSYFPILWLIPLLEIIMEGNERKK